MGGATLGILLKIADLSSAGKFFGLEIRKS
jgi:hypothetical protein